MKKNKHLINVCLTSDQLYKYEIENSIVVVIDILRATSVISTAFHYGIKSVKPVSTIEEAINYKQNKDYLVISVFKAIENVKGPIFKSLKNIDTEDQSKIDKILKDLDGTEQKKKLGANAILAVSIAAIKNAALERKVSLFKHIGGNSVNKLPIPMMNIINGGAHANNSLEIQEFMIRPDGANSFKECMRMSYLVIQKLKKNL